MANKKEEKIEMEESQEKETITVKEPVIKTPIIKEKPKSKNDWEIKDRVYYLKGGKRPLSRMIRSANIYWFDEEAGHERELKYCENQRTPFVDEMKGDQRLSHIIFRSGVLHVTREKTILQKLLSLYHPERDVSYYEWKPTEVAADQIDILEYEIEALVAARNLDIEMAEAVLRVEVGSGVSNMSSKEIKRDLLLYAKRNPELFLELVNDENVQLRNFGIKATENGIIKLSNDQRYFIWTSTSRKIMTVPFDEHPYSALAAWFKTDEGMEIYSNIEKRMK